MNHINESSSSLASLDATRCVGLDDGPVATRTRGLKRKVEWSDNDTRLNKRSRTKATSIKNLPNEILLEVFNKLDQASLKSSVLVNSKWHDIITRSTSTMRKMPLHLVQECSEDYVEVKLSRKYESMKCSKIHVWNTTNILRSVQTIGRSVKELHLFDCSFLWNDFTNLVSCLQCLETLTVRWCNCLGSPEQPLIPVQLPQLKQMSVKGDAWMFDQIACNLKDLQVSRLSANQAAFINFLNNQKTLESLSLHNIKNLFCPKDSDRQIVMDFKFQLRSLSMNNLPFANGYHMIKLLKQAQNCADVSLGFDLNILSAPFILQTFSNMEYLYIDAELLPQQRSFYFGLRPNKTLKDLKIDGDINDSVVLLNLFSHFPNIRSLNIMELTGIHCNDDTFWKTMSSIFTKIERLKLRELNSDNMSNLKLPLLKFCEVEYLGNLNLESLIEFGRNNPAIEF